MTAPTKDALPDVVTCGAVELRRHGSYYTDESRGFNVDRIGNKWKAQHVAFDYFEAGPDPQSACDALAAKLTALRERLEGWGL